MLSIPEIETKFNDYLQKDVEFILDNKPIKSGKLILFSIKSFYLTFILSTEGKSRHTTFELPYPFTTNFHYNSAFFDYHTENIFKGNIDTECRSLLYSYKKPLRYFQNEIVMRNIGNY